VEVTPVVFVSIASAQQRQALFALTSQAIGRVARRAWMVLWSDERVSVAEIAHRLHCRPKTVRKWLHRFARAGVDGLSDGPRAGRPRRVSAVAEQVVFTQLNQPPWTFGYAFAIWTVARLCQHLRERCRLSLSNWRVRLLLRHLRYRFARPKVAPRRVDPEREAVHQQIGRRIHEVRHSAPETVIVVEDETDIRLFPVLRRMWMRIGAQVRLVAPLTNQRRTIFGVIDIEAMTVFQRAYRRKRSEEMIAFLTDLLSYYAGRPVLVLLDHASIHKSKKVRVWLSQHPQVELLYLPKYSGHKDNPIEKLWWHLKGYAAANRCCRSMDELLTAVQRYFDQLRPDKLIQLVA
jgi:transposase